MNVSVEVFNGTHVLLTFDYSQGVSRDCQVVYYRVATQADDSVSCAAHVLTANTNTNTHIYSMQ